MREVHLKEQSASLVVGTTGVEVSISGEERE